MPPTVVQAYNHHAANSIQVDPLRSSTYHIPLSAISLLPSRPPGTLPTLSKVISTQSTCTLALTHRTKNTTASSQPKEPLGSKTAGYSCPVCPVDPLFLAPCQPNPNARKQRAATPYYHSAVSHAEGEQFSNVEYCYVSLAVLTWFIPAGYYTYSAKRSSRPVTPL